MNNIGGSFEFTSEVLAASIVADPNKQVGITQDKSYWTRSGRSGIALVLKSWHKQLSDGWILMPDYQCWDISSVFDKVDKKYILVNDNLELEISDLEAFLKDQKLRAVLLIDYFGLSNIQPYIERIKTLRPDVLIIVDAVQAFLSLVFLENLYLGADAIISSPRKFLPIPDGGLVIFKNEKPIFNLTKNNDTLTKQISYFVAAGLLKDSKIKGSYDLESLTYMETLYLDFFECHKRLFDNEIKAISSFSFRIIERTDLKLIAKKRLKSFEWMSNSLKDKKYANIIRPIFTEISSPGLIFPVRVLSQQRDSLRNYLKSKGIYCPVYWPIQESQLPFLGESSKQLIGEILGLPIDQRYDNSELSKILEEIMLFNKANHL